MVLATYLRDPNQACRVLQKRFSNKTRKTKILRNGPWSIGHLLLDHESSNPTEVNKFYAKIVVEKDKNKQKDF